MAGYSSGGLGISRLAAVAAMLAIGCAARYGTPARLDTPAAAPLSFKGHLLDADPGEIPPALAGALEDASPITFSYREELRHDHFTVPMLLSALNPLTYLGAPLGSYTVTAFAALAIADRGRPVGDYSAQAEVSARYGLYYGTTYRDLEKQVRDQVREKIDAELYADLPRLEAAINAAAKP